MRSSSVSRAGRRLLAAGLIIVAAAGGLLVAGRAGAAPGTIKLPSGRTYLLHAPAQRTPSPRPLVVALHGALQSAVNVERMSGLDMFADVNRMVVAYGQAVDGRWNAGSCCAIHPQDDLGYLRAVVDDVARRTPIDRTRVYVVGFSNGGMMAWRAACEAPDVFAGAGVVAGALLVPCTRTTVRVFHVHGTIDGTVPLTGGLGFESHHFPDSRAELTRVGAGSTVRTSWWAGGHAWPDWATSTIMPWLTSARRGGQPVIPAPHPAPLPVNH